MQSIQLITKFSLIIASLLCMSCFSYALTTPIINQPSVYTIPSTLVAYKASTMFDSNTAVNNIQYNVLHLNQEFIYQKASLDYILTKLDSVSTGVSSLLNSPPSGLTLAQLQSELVVLKSDLNSSTSNAISTLNDIVSFLSGTLASIAFVSVLSRSYASV